MIICDTAQVEIYLSKEPAKILRLVLGTLTEETSNKKCYHISILPKRLFFSIGLFHEPEVNYQQFVTKSYSFRSI